VLPASTWALEEATGTISQASRVEKLRLVTRDHQDGTRARTRAYGTGGSHKIRDKSRKGGLKEKKKKKETRRRDKLTVTKIRTEYALRSEHKMRRVSGAAAKREEGSDPVTGGREI
jgi:hypothetical protein